MEQPETGDFRRGANFASAGAGALVDTFRGSVIDLNTQLMYFEKVEIKLRHDLGEIISKNIISNAVYLFSIGTNDYLSYFLTNSSANNLTDFSSFKPYFSSYVNTVIGNLSNVVKNIYQKGGRKFGFLNLGDLGCLPGLRVLHLESNGGGCLEAATLVAKLHNFELYKLLSKLEHQLEGFKYSLGDFNRALRQRIKHPSHFGLKEGRVACCGAGAFKGIFSCGGRRPMVENEFELCQNPQQHVFWDSYHLTEAVYGQMAAEMWNGSSFAGHYYLQALFNC
ncbi:OLC1v1015223C2 [Oldenlandia corymbosa var. corymbosa]|nr:OLC1v1015223C2 [Oldenlandia corymbosa var. corymbosa]